MFDGAYFLNTFFTLLPALPLTFFLALGSFFCGGVLGFVFALIRVFEVKYLNSILILYISFFRGTPLLVQLFMFYYGLPMQVHICVKYSVQPYSLWIKDKLKQLTH